MGEKVACGTIFPYCYLYCLLYHSPYCYLYCLLYHSPHCYLYCLLYHSPHCYLDCLSDSHSPTLEIWIMEFYHVMKITIVESNPDIGLLTQQTLCFSPSVLARASRLPMMTILVTSDQGWKKPNKTATLFPVPGPTHSGTGWKKKEKEKEPKCVSAAEN